MTDFEVMPIGTRQAMQEAAKLLRELAPELADLMKFTATCCNTAAARLEKLLEPEDNGGFTMDEAEGHRRFEAARAVGFEPPPQDEAFSVPSNSAWQPPSKEPPLDGC